MASSKSLLNYMSQRPMSSSSATNTTSRMERDLLERMVQERDEKITALQKTIGLQKKFTEKIQGILDDTRIRHKQDITRLKINLDSAQIEKELAQTQLKALTKERDKHKESMLQLQAGVASNKLVPVDPAVLKRTKVAADRAADNNNNDTKNPQSPPPGDAQQQQEEPTLKPITKLESAHALYLQAQLYQALHSIGTLQTQTTALKKNYDSVIESLQEDLTEVTDEKSKMEVELMSQLALLEREKGVMEGLLEENLKARNAKVKTLEKKVRKYEGIDDGIVHKGSADAESDSDSDSDSEDSSVDADDEHERMGMDGHEDLSTVEETSITPSQMEREDESDSDADSDTDGDEGLRSSSDESSGSSAKDQNMKHEQMESLLEELELLSERSVASPPNKAK